MPRPGLEVFSVSELFQVNLGTKDHHEEEYEHWESNTSLPKNQALFNRLLIQNLKQVAGELKAQSPNACNQLRLDELIDDQEHT